jgi:hypothetical protein
MPDLKRFNKPSARRDKFQEIAQWYHQSKDDRAEWEDLRAYLWNLYTGKAGRPIKPWPNASDIFVPLAAKLVDGMVPRLVQATLGADPPAHVKPIETGDIEESDLQELFLKWALEAHVPNFFLEINNWYRMGCIDGTSIIKTFWDERIERTRQKYTMSRYGYPGETIAGQLIEGDEPVELEDEDFIETLLRIKDKLKKREGIWHCKIKEGHKWVDTEVEIVYPDDKDDERVSIYVARESQAYSGPIIEVCNLEDIYLPFRAKDIQTADFVIHEIWLTLDQLAQRKKQGIYKFTPAEWKRLVNFKDFGDPLSDSSRQTEIDIQQGFAAANFYRRGKFAAWEVYCYDDVNDDYLAENMIYTAIPLIDCLCRYQYLEEEFPHGHRPFASIVYMPVQGRFYGRGIPEIIASLQIEANTIINQINDRENLINNPFFFYEPTAGTDPNVILRVEPGMGVPVGDASKITFPNFGKNPMSGIELLQLITQFAEEVIGLGPNQLGQRRPGSSPRTARGTGMLIAEGNTKVDAHIKLIQECGLTELFFQIFTLYAELGPDDVFFRVTGEERPRKLSRSALRGRWDFILTGNTANTNREIQQNIATILYQTFGQEPLMMQDLGARQQLVKNVIRNYNDGNYNPEDITPRIPVQLRPRSPDEVIALLAQGVRIEPRFGEDPMGMIKALDGFTKKPEFDMVPMQYVPLFAEAVQAYQTLALMSQQMMSQAGSNPNMAPSAPPGSNDLSTPMESGPQMGMPTQSMPTESR